MKKLLTIFALLCLGISSTQAQYTDIVNFDGPTAPQGEYPTGDVIRVGNLLYGMAPYGGAHDFGCIFSVDTNGNNYKDRWDFNQGHDSNGALPFGSLTLSGGKLYGMTYYGGIHDSGNIFRIDTNGGGYKDIWDFQYAHDSNGANPRGSLILSGGQLYGMTYFGGINGDGNIFRIDTNGGGYKDIWDFHYAHDSNGAEPYGSLILSGGKLYGMTYYGGTDDSGNIFSIDTTGGGYKDLWNFNQSFDSSGAFPEGNLTLSGGKLYGMTGAGGINNDGSIFRIDTNGNGYKDLWDFHENNDSNGAYPGGDLTLSGGKLYGMTYGGGIHDKGNIFRIDTNGGGYKDLVDFNNTDGESPQRSLTLSGGVFYGMTYNGGTNGFGVVFSFIDTTINTSINNLTATKGSITVYPNPCNGIFTVAPGSHPGLVSGAQTIEIYNVLGEKVYSQYSIPTTQYSLNLSNQPSGVYLYRVITQTGNLLGEGKIIIQK